MCPAQPRAVRRVRRVRRRGTGRALAALAGTLCPRRAVWQRPVPGPRAAARAGTDSGLLDPYRARFKLT